MYLFFKSIIIIIWDPENVVRKLFCTHCSMDKPSVCDYLLNIIGFTNKTRSQAIVFIADLLCSKILILRPKIGIRH